VIAIEHRHVQANGITFHVAVSGKEDAPPILCLHGYPEGWMSWRHVMELLPDCRIYAPDLRGFPGTSQPKDGYDVFTLTDDVKALIEVLGIQGALLVTHDWGGAIGWIFAHRYSSMIRRLMVVNCTHTKTLVRAAFTFEDLQPFRIPWVLPYQVPFLPEWFMTTNVGRKLLRWSFIVREGEPGTMDRALVDEIVAHFKNWRDMHGPVEYYRGFIRTLLFPSQRSRLYDLYKTPITAPVTLVWGLKDAALPASIGIKSFYDAGCEGDWRPLPGVNHFVDLEAWQKLADEILRVYTA
jgi:epoxide hydrolase 4